MAHFAKTMRLLGHMTSIGSSSGVQECLLSRQHKSNRYKHCMPVKAVGEGLWHTAKWRGIVNLQNTHGEYRSTVRYQNKGGQLTKVLGLSNPASNANGEGQAGVWPLLCCHRNGQQWNLSCLQCNPMYCSRLALGLIQVTRLPCLSSQKQTGAESLLLALLYHVLAC